MATNGANNVEDTEMECDGEKVVTMMDVLQEQQEFEEDAKAVLGASDDMNCTYSKGYIKRQAIYACLTCCADARQDETKRAGVCLACSLNCHENHELIELYTKRSFRCDCGNPKFNSNPCTFTPNKTEFNLDNNYNQNFSGIYCICRRPYPDPEATEEEEMIQCIICEDWLHANHLDAIVPVNEQYSEMVCKACMEKNEFLHDYNNLAVNVEMGDIDIVSINGKDSLSYGTADNTLTNGDNIPDSVIEDTKMETNKNDINLENSEKEDKEQDSIVKDNIEMEMDTNRILENSEKEDKEQPTTDSCPQNDSENLEKLEKVAESNTDEKNESDSEISAKHEVENNKSTDEDTENTTTESNTVIPETNSNTSDNVANTQTIVDQNKDTDKGSLNENDETLEHVSGDKDSKNSDANETEPENDVPKTNEDTKEVDSVKIDGCNEPETTDEVEKQLSDMHNESEPQNVEAKSDAEIPMDTTESEVVKGESKETSEATTTAADTLKEPSEDKITNSEVAHQETTTKDDENSITDTNKLDSIESDKSDTITSTDKFSLKDDQNSTKLGNTHNNALETSDNLTKVNEPATDSPNTIEKRKSNEDPDDTLAKKPKLDQCLRPRNVKRVHKGATFWPSTFRQKLCTCSECITMYKDLSVLFLIDPEDTVSAYETLGKEKFKGEPSTQYEKGLKALSSLDRIQQINALTEYNKMRDKLLDFLKSFKDKKEVVKEEDIRAFFAGMKPKREPDGVYFCR